MHTLVSPGPGWLLPWGSTLGGESDVYRAWLCGGVAGVAVVVVAVVGCRRHVVAAAAVRERIQTRVGVANWLQHRCICLLAMRVGPELVSSQDTATAAPSLPVTAGPLFT